MTATSGTPCWPIADERGYKPGWAAHKYKEKFGAFPPWGPSRIDRADAAKCARGCARE